MKITKFQPNEGIYILSTEEKLALTESRVQYKNDKYISDDEANAKYDKWLGE